MKNNKLMDSFRYAFIGIITAVKDERNMKIHFTAAVLVFLFGFLLRISEIEWIVCVAWIALVIGAEMFNTAIENVVDLVTSEYSPFAKKAKDISAGAVLVVAIGAAISGCFIFIPKLVGFL